MGRNLMIVVSDDSDFIVSTRANCEARGGTFKVYSSEEWTRQINTPGFAHALTGEPPQPQQGAKILPFPGMGGGSVPTGGKVQTIDEMESEAIRQAIENFRGNLTEAARALGIGRATLYRKVKQYNIDPNEARRRKHAA